MKITVLGRWGAYPEAGEATPGYLLQTDQHNILLDCGSGVLSKLFYHVRQEELDAVFISHFHHDHCADLGCLFYASKVAVGFKKRLVPLPVYAPNRSERFSELSFGEYSDSAFLVYLYYNTFGGRSLRNENNRSPGFDKMFGVRKRRSGFWLSRRIGTDAL